LKELTNPGDAAGQGQPEWNTIFSGTKSLKITEYQRFQRRMPGWEYAIREKPEPGQYRFLRLAWKAEGCTCLMLQLHDATDWHIRYTAGPNPYGWASKFVADKAPSNWTLITLDLYKDFGERTLTGIAFTIHGGAGYFDHVYLGRTIEDLDRIDANGLTKKEIKLERQQLETAWQDLTAEDASKQYRAFWTLVAGGKQTESFVKEKLGGGNLSEKDADQIRRWIGDLDSSSFAARENASKELKQRMREAQPLVEAALAGNVSIEARRRLEQLLAAAPLGDGERKRREQALRILRFHKS
jgi:hypothetical protein